MLFEELLRAIRESPFFHGMAMEEQMLLARLGRVDEHPVGGVLFRPGETPSAFYLVLDGVVEICREESPEVGLQAVAYLGDDAVGSEDSGLMLFSRFPFEALPIDTYRADGGSPP